MNLEELISEPGTCKTCLNWGNVKGRYYVVGHGLFCSMKCIESELFGEEHCRWCGKKMHNTYTYVESRLCSEDCRVNYFARVWGNKSAALGTGVRFSSWWENRRLERKMAGLWRVRKHRHETSL